MSQRYLNPVKRGGCCTLGEGIHRTCNCLNNVTLCKSYCDNDHKCKGYYGKEHGQCRIATTSKCPNSCEVMSGGQDGLVPNTQCGIGNGCFVKKPRKEFII